MNDPARERQNAVRQGRSGVGYMVVFGLFWCAFVGMFDFFILRSFIPQVGSIWFQPAPAQIVKGEVTGSGDSYGVAFEYTYSVEGKDYTGTRYTFDKTTSSDSAWARKAVAEYPAGSTTTCYYDPNNPARAVLSRGIHGSDLTSDVHYSVQHRRAVPARDARLEVAPARTPATYGAARHGSPPQH